MSIERYACSKWSFGNLGQKIKTKSDSNACSCKKKKEEEKEKVLKKDKEMDHSSKTK
jgi:hypothetical protein